MRPIVTESTDIVGLASGMARHDGLFAGLTSGFVGAIIGSKLMGFGRNKTIFCGILTGVVSGYLFTQAFFETHLAQLRAEQRQANKRKGGAADDGGSSRDLANPA